MKTLKHTKTKTCIVCLIEPDENHQQQTNCCGAEFCQKCSNEWYEKRKKDNLKFNCPLCRKNLSVLYTKTFSDNSNNSWLKLLEQRHDEESSDEEEDEISHNYIEDEERTIDYYDYDGPVYEDEYETNIHNLDEFCMPIDLH